MSPEPTEPGKATIWKICRICGDEFCGPTEDVCHPCLPRAKHQVEWRKNFKEPPVDYKRRAAAEEEKKP